MMMRVVSRLSRVRVTLAYAAALAAVGAVMLHLRPQAQQSMILDASTNLRNLADGRFGTLIGSAFVSHAGSVFRWLPGLVALLALGELLWRSGRLALAFAVGHIGTTLVVAVGIAAALKAGLVGPAIVDAADVGMSYGAVAVLGTFTAALPRPWRAAWAGGWLALAAGSAALAGGDFTTVGHAVALILGIAMGNRFGVPQRWTAARYLLLAVAAAFGYLVITYGDPTNVRTVCLGLAGAAVSLAASVLAGSRGGQTNSSAEASIQSDSHVGGGLSSSSPGISHS